MAATSTPVDGAPNDNSNAPNVLDEISAKAPAGTILPPRNIRDIIEKTAGYVHRNGKHFEDQIRQKSGQTGKMSFLDPEDAYRAYYIWRLSEITEGRGTNISAGRKADEVSFAGREERKGPEKPEEFQFSARMPNISAQDLEIVKLTAIFAARNGRTWMNTLSQREMGNFQFDFLRPQHSLYQFFTRLVDQYTDLLQGGEVDGGRPQKKRISELEANSTNRFRILERAKKRAEWVKYQEAQKVEQEEKQEKERVMYAQIDWHDFVVVETVTFDEADEHAQLPAPTTLNDIQSRSLEQKAAWGNDPGRRIEEAMPGMDDYENFYNQAPQAPPAQQQPAPQPSPQPPPQQTQAEELAAARAHARAAQEAASARTPTPNSQNNIRIRQNYTPAALNRNKAAPNTSLCPNCHQSIPNDEMAQHLKIEMLHPEWRDQYKIAQQRSSTTNLSTADVASNLKRLASQRSDVFDPVTGRVLEGGGGGKRVEVEQGVPGQQGQQQGQGQGEGEGERSRDVQEQIRAIHERARNG
ncbi:SF3a splicing factor complex subunit [Saxophila tyrrhenica]|uniref:SF3a splicing factor complex subunit n=1 Tax=Saxophila tyrrhenica TaxID=1690608 RepID=A0AAV9NX53_9PEZI|nr:SF3a splicing factor complex subunit [Saxophila tyrrhenica]